MRDHDRIILHSDSKNYDRLDNYYHWLFGYHFPLIYHCITYPGSYFGVACADYAYLNHTNTPPNCDTLDLIKIHHLSKHFPTHLLPRWDHPQGIISKECETAKQWVVENTQTVASAHKIVVVNRVNCVRSCPSMHPVADALKMIYDNVVLVELENTSFNYQYSLFRSADIVIAQFGTALTNILWCKPTTHIIEIVPSFRTTHKNRYTDVIDDYHSISDMVGCSHHQIIQLHHRQLMTDNSNRMRYYVRDVNVEQLVSMVGEIYDTT